jgi:cephalosporin-C deacetylase-like acetyl esterase
VLHPPGHFPEGKAAYQRVAAVLASKGISVLVPDPIGQGERDEFVDLETGRRTIARACRSHAVVGDPMYLLGKNVALFRLLDGMRSIDWLSERADVDRHRIGVAGTSGGGWEAIWLGALDTRIQAICSSCYLTTWSRRMDRRCDDPEPDPEQDVFAILEEVITAADLLLACMPRPVALGATVHDFFPLDGTRSCHDDAVRAYTAAGCGEKIDLAIADAGHEYVLPLRQQVYGWMQRWLGQTDGTDVSEPDDLELVEEWDTFCTPTGNALISLGGVSISQINAHAAWRLALERREYPPSATTIRQALRNALRLPVEGAGSVSVSCTSQMREGGFDIQYMDVTSEGGLSAQAWIRIPAGGGKMPALLMIGNGIDPKTIGGADPHLVVAGIDLAGSDPGSEQDLDFVPLNESGLAYNAFLLGRCLPGIRSVHALAMANHLLGHPNVDHQRVSMCGRGHAAMIALISGAYDTRIAQVIEIEPLTSLSSLCWNREYAWSVSMIIPNALKSFDLGDLRMMMALRQLRVVNPLDHAQRPLSAAACECEFAEVRRAFSSAGGSHLLSIDPLPISASCNSDVISDAIYAACQVDSLAIRQPSGTTEV